MRRVEAAARHRSRGQQSTPGQLDIHRGRAVISASAPRLSSARHHAGRMKRDANDWKTQPSSCGHARSRLDGAAGYRLSIEALDGARSVNAERHHRRRKGNDPPQSSSRLTGERPLTPLGGAALLTRERGPRCARTRGSQLPQLSREVPRRLMALRHLLRSRHPHVAHVARAGRCSHPPSRAASTPCSRASHPTAKPRTRKTSASSPILRNAKDGRERTDPPDLRLRHGGRRLHARPTRRAAGCWSNDTPRPRAQAFPRSPDSKRRPCTAMRSSVTSNGSCNEPQRSQPTPPRRNWSASNPAAAPANGATAKKGSDAGVYAYDVNVALRPRRARRNRSSSRQRATHRLPEGTPATHAQARASAVGSVVAVGCAPLCACRFPRERARTSITSYAAALGVPAASALEAVGNDVVSFNAPSLDEQGHPVPVMHSDDGFALLFDHAAARSSRARRRDAHAAVPRRTVDADRHARCKPGTRRS